MFQLLRLFRWIALLEGVSFLLLLGVAMPLKYVAGQPQGVRVIGMAHGLLFITYVLLLLTLVVKRWCSVRKAIKAFGLSLLPFGTFLLDRSLRADLADLAPDHDSLGISGTTR
jgi:integral membrane protein